MPSDEMNAFDLPKICVISGSKDNVVFRPVKFSWFPKWISVFGVAPLIMVILIAVMTRRVKGELPFSDEAYRVMKTKKIIFGLSILPALGMIVGGAFLLEAASGVGLSIMVLGFVAFLTVIVLGQKVGPTVVRIDQGTVTLKLPSDEASALFEQHLRGRAAKAA